MYVYHVNAWCPTEARRRHLNPWTRATDGCDLPCWCCKSNLGLLEGQQVLTSPCHLPSPGFIIFIIIIIIILNVFGVPLYHPVPYSLDTGSLTELELGQ